MVRMFYVDLQKMSDLDVPFYGQQLSVTVTQLRHKDTDKDSTLGKGEHLGGPSLCSEWAWRTQLSSETHLAKLSRKKFLSCWHIGVIGVLS